MKACIRMYRGFAAILLTLTVISPTLAVETSGPTVDDLAGRRVMILGDSITNGGRYASYIDYFLQSKYPDKTFDILSIGLSSETASGLSERDHPFPRPCIHERLDRALAKVQPDIVVACYGMNDGIYHPQSPERMKAYQDGIMQLVAKCRAAGAKVVLMTPPPFDPTAKPTALVGENAPEYGYKTPYNKYDSVLKDYAKWIMTVQSDDVITSVDLNAPMSEYLAEQRKTDPAFRLSGDGIHPGSAGHLLMALAFLKAFGIEAAEGDAQEQTKEVDADPLFQLVDKRRVTRSRGWLPYVGYTRGETVTREGIEDVVVEAAKLQVEIDTLRK